VRVTLDVVGGEEHEFDVDEATYADLLAAVGLSPNEVAVLVNGRPVPEDQPVEAGRARVLRLVSGGSGRGSVVPVPAVHEGVAEGGDAPQEEIGTQLAGQADLRVAVGGQECHLGLVPGRPD
jgi:sulfur carrier protein